MVFRLTSRGVSLVEMLVALLLLEITGVAALLAILTSERTGRHGTRAAITDTDRWTSYRAAELGCADSNLAYALPFTIAGDAVRRSLALELLCGQ